MPRETATPYRLRHLALLFGVMLLAAGAPAARPDVSVLLLVAGLGALNLAADHWLPLHRAPRLLRSFPGLFAPLGWALLVAETGGVRSPFLVGLALEVALAGQFGSTLRSAAVTVLSVVVLVLDAALASPTGDVDRALIPGALLLALGAASAAGARRWRRREADTLKESARLHDRLAALERQLPSGAASPAGDTPIRVAHGLRGVVHSLRGFAALLEEEELPAVRQRRLLDLVATMADRVEELSGAAMGVTAGAGAAGGRPARLDVTLTSVLDRFLWSWPAVTVRDSEGERGARVAISRHDLEEVLRNLLTNAAEAMSGNGVIEVDGLELPGERWRLRVRDHGPGVAEPLRSRLGSPGASNRGPGRGYGLYLVRRLVESAGGRLVIEPAPGGGTQVDVILPLAGALREPL
jgi:signal transduction histidine kinase